MTLSAQWIRCAPAGVLALGAAALGLPVAQRFDTPAPLAAGFVTVGTDSGHPNKPGKAAQAVAANPEAFTHFATQAARF